MWRFYVAIGAFALAMVFLITGLAFKILGGPHKFSENIRLDAQANYAVIDQDVIAVRPGLQTVVAQGAAENLVAYGRTVDVTSWIGSSPYMQISLDKSGKITQKLVTPEVKEGAPAPTIVNPDGSDMWIDHATGIKEPAVLEMALPADMSVLVSGNGQEVVPSLVTLSWPLPQPTFLWMNDDQLLLLGGGIAFLGIAVYLWALADYRRRMGPRRKTPKAPRPRSIRQRPHSGISAPRTRGRRSLSFLALPLGVGLVLGMSACSSPMNPVATTPTPTSTGGALSDLPPVAVTQSQFVVMMRNAAATVVAADAALEGPQAEARFAGPALEARKANYAIRKADSSLGTITPLPETKAALFLPEATDSWPRSVLAIFQPSTQKGKKKDDPATGPTRAFMLEQTSPRENYKIVYEVNLQANQEVPEVATADVGTVAVPADSKLLVLPPNEVAAAYADVLMKGDASSYAPLFDGEKDSLRSSLVTERAQQAADNVDVTYVDQAGSSAPIALGTVAGPAGAIVAVTVDEMGTYAPVGGRNLKLTGALKALAGTELSPRSIDATYQYQLMFFVPPAGSNERITLLGYSENLVKVTQQ